MAPMRGERGGSPARGARASLPLPRRLIRQIARHVAESGRSLRRLEVSGRVIDNFDDLGGASDDSDMDVPQTAVACGNAGSLPPADHDDDLTSLSWLQDRNLLSGINLTKGDVEDGKIVASHLILKPEPGTPPPLPPPSPPRTPVKAPPSPPPAHSKPPYSFSCLIFMAIEAAPTRALPVKEIYAWIIRHFPYFKHAPQGWKNSVRHNLSLNKCFHKVAAAPGIGKGSLWTVDPQHRTTLMQAFGRQPVPLSPCPSPSPPPDSAPQQPLRNGVDPQQPLRNEMDPQQVLRNGLDPQQPFMNGMDPQQVFRSCPDPQQPLRNGLDIQQPLRNILDSVQTQKNGLDPQQPFKNGLDSQETFRNMSDSQQVYNSYLNPQQLRTSPDPQLRTSPDPHQPLRNAPDPQLFPFLARRLAGDARPPPGADEYLAAATVLAMKYGPAVLDQLPPEAHLVISRCARDEHSYSGGFEERRTAEALLNLAGVVEPS